MNFDYNTMYKEFFSIYESFKRKYSFLSLSNKEFKEIIIKTTIASLESNEDSSREMFKIVLINNLEVFLKQVATLKIRDNQYYYLDNYFAKLKIDNQSYEDFLNTLKDILKFLDTYDVRISDETANQLIVNNLNVCKVIKYCYQYNEKLKRTTLLKNYNINILLFWYGMSQNESIPSEEKSFTRKENSLGVKKNNHNINKPKISLTKKDDLLSLYTIFEDYSHEEVKNAYACLTEANKMVLSKVYNAYLEPVYDVKITGKERATIKRVIYVNLETILKRNKGQQSLKNNLYYRYKGYTKEEVMTVIQNLDFETQAMIGIRYDINGNYKNDKISKKLNNKLRSIILGIIPRRLGKLRMERLINYLNLYYCTAYSLEQIIETLKRFDQEFQEKLYQSLEFTNNELVVKNEQSFNKYIAMFDQEIRKIDTKDIVVAKIKDEYGHSADELVKVLLMKLGFVNDKIYTNEEISKILMISLEQVKLDLEILRKLTGDIDKNNKTSGKSLKREK